MSVALRDGGVSGAAKPARTVRQFLIGHQSIAHHQPFKPEIYSGCVNGDPFLRSVCAFVPWSLASSTHNSAMSSLSVPKSFTGARLSSASATYAAPFEALVHSGVQVARSSEFADLLQR